MTIFASVFSNLTDGGEVRGESFFEAVALRRNSGKDTYYFIRHHPSNNTFLIAQSFRDGAKNEFSVLGWTLSQTKTYKPSIRRSDARTVVSGYVFLVKL